MVDVAAQNLMCAAMSTKSDENAYLSDVHCFVKRMAHANAIVKVDPAPALEGVGGQDRAEGKRRWHPAQG